MKHEKGTFGRPTKYRQDLIEKVDEYLATCVDEEGEFHKTRGATSNSYERTLKVNLPKLEGFSRFIGVDHGNMLEWEKQHEDFSKALNKIRKAQHDRLIDQTLAGNYNPLIAKLILSSNHGYREKSDVTTNDESINVGIANLLVKAYGYEDGTSEATRGETS